MQTEKIEVKGNKAVVRAEKGYMPHIDKLLTLKDTGNGYIAKFHSPSSAHQDYYVCLDYAQAYDLYNALAAIGFSKSEGKK